MSEIRVYREPEPDTALTTSDDPAAIADILSGIGVRFEQWRASADIAPGDGQDEIIEAYRAQIDALKAQEGYVTVDVVSLSADHPEKDAFRAKFLAEHTHSEDEVRFFVAGQGLFSLHVEEHVYEVLCTRGDLISVPAHTRHWFDMGPNPDFVAIRLFNNPEGWVAKFTGNDIAERFNRLEN